jgi:hypothetical protein
MKKSLSKLQLHRETLAALTSQSLPQVLGGISDSCTTVCSQCPWVPFPTRNRTEC